MREAITAPAAPTPVGPYTVAVADDSLIFCSAQAGLDPATGSLAPGGIGPETEQALTNLEAVLAAAGRTFADVLKTTIYLTDITDFALVNEIYGRRVGATPPARTTVGVAALPIAAKIEIEMVATRA